MLTKEALSEKNEPVDAIDFKENEDTGLDNFTSFRDVRPGAV